LVIVAIVSLVSSCAGYYETVMKSSDVDLKYEAAFNYYNNGKYRKSAEIFESLILLMQGLPQEDTVQYYTALSNYKMRDYITAESNFDKFINVFPRSPFTEEAKFLRIKCLYEGTYRYELDQVPTRKAMTVIGEFMYENPSSPHYDECNAMMDEFKERLDKKSYESAKLYYTIEDYKAAHYALKNVLKENSDNIYREDVLYFTAMASYKYALNSVQQKQKERYLVFIDDYYNFVGEYPESVRRKELDGYYEKAQIYTKKETPEEESETLVLSKEEQKELIRQNKKAMKEVKKAAKIKTEN
jgi:outer membrane protein assembly factor BamD